MPTMAISATQAAVRCARAHTRREKIVRCGYHGWHDWYLAANRTTQPGNDPLQKVDGVNFGVGQQIGVAHVSAFRTEFGRDLVGF